MSDTFTDIYATYFPAAAGLARSMTREAAAAEDIAADGLLRMWRHWDGDEIAQPWGYLRRIVINEIFDRSRRQARERAATGRYKPPVQADCEQAAVDRDLVRRLLGRLPAHQRRIIELRFLADLSERETALRLGISVGAVKSGTSRALARLRGATSDWDD
jgi:RNA polymerase sigma factor (sigma-70 family)